MEISKKICSKCKVESDISNFRFRKDRNRYRIECNNCLSKKDKDYYHSNKNKIIERNSNYYENNKEYISNKKKEYYEKNKDLWINYQKQYREENKISLNDKRIKYYQKNKTMLNKRNGARKISRRKVDSIFAIRTDLSSAINSELKKNNSSKKGNSILKYLPYSIKELKEYLESQFESWMTWLNRGKYNSKLWNDNDQSTWTWQIDHIVPHSTFKYTSMNDDSFKECWTLSNLRPYSAKQNILDGARK